MSSRVRGTNKLRRTLNRIDPNIKRRVKDSVRWSAREIELDAIGYAIAKDVRDTGEMIQSIGKRFSSDGLSAHIGPGAEYMPKKNTRVIRSYVTKNPFSNAVLEGLNFKTGKRKGDLAFMRDSEARWNFMKGYWHEFGTRAVDPMPPHPLPPRPFMGAAWDTNKARVRMAVDKAVTSALREAARGG